MTNRQIIREKVKSIGCKLGCYDKSINKLNSEGLNKVIEGLTGDSTDVHVEMNNRKYVVEIASVDNELDFMMLSYGEYVDRYGEPEEDE